MNDNSSVLVVDDDRDLVEVLTFILGRAGFTVLGAHEVREALFLVERENPLAAILDVRLGDGDGFELLRQIRERSDLPIIMLTGLKDEEDLLRGFELGADDYLTKPFRHRELVLRLRAILRRRGLTAAAVVLQSGGITLNRTEHRVEVAGKEVRLTATEFKLLDCLMSNAGTVMAAHVLLKHVWNYNDADGVNVVRATMHRLRRKLETVSSESSVIHTVPGVGFMFKADEPASSTLP